ncbi:hypothetical protein [Chryseobacterium vrystaatense]|nr:hypothetical protein [Chryseobacterium vrystaatense]
MIKVAITLRALLERNRNKNYADPNAENKALVNSYEKIATNSSSDIRKATITNAFSGKKKSTMITVILIVDSLGYTMNDFGEQYDKITDKDIVEFKENILKIKS